MGWDCDTSGVTAWMTAVNLGSGLLPEVPNQETNKQANKKIFDQKFQNTKGAHILHY